MICQPTKSDDLRFATRVFCRQIRGHDATSVKNLGESFLGLVKKVKKLRLHILDPFLGINQPANTTQLNSNSNSTQTEPNSNSNSTQTQTQTQLKLKPTQTQPNSNPTQTKPIPKQLNFSTNPTTTQPKPQHHESNPRNPRPMRTIKSGSADGGPRDAGDYFDDGLEHCAGLDPAKKFRQTDKREFGEFPINLEKLTQKNQPKPPLPVA